jgi:hypothetical protein
MVVKVVMVDYPVVQVLVVQELLEAPRVTEELCIQVVSLVITME